MQAGPSQLTQLALISGAFALFGAMLGAMIAGAYNLRAKQREYVNDYYKTVVQRRIAAYEQLESLIIDFKLSVVDDKDRKLYHLPFSAAILKESMFKRLTSVMSQGLWLSDEADMRVRDLFLDLFNMPAEGDAINFGKQHYQAIAKVRDSLERTLAADMLELHEVERFLKLKKNRPDPGFQDIAPRLGGPLS